MAGTAQGGRHGPLASVPRVQDGLPLRAEACSVAGEPPPLSLSASQATSFWNFHTCSWLAQEKEMGNRRHPWECRGEGGKPLPTLKRMRSLFPGLKQYP